jgi:hypothetical protein
MKACVKPIKKLAVLSVLSAFICALQAQGQTLTSGNSTATINPLNQSGWNSWVVDGQTQINPTAPTGQWFWYSVGSSPTASIDTLALTQDSQSAGPDKLLIGYAGAGFNLSIEYSLDGGATHSYQSDMSEQMTIYNTSGSALAFSFYKYSDFAIQGGIGNYNLAISSGPFGGYNGAYQISQRMALQENVVTPMANATEAAQEYSTLTKLNTGPYPVTLDNITTATGNVTSTFEWSYIIPAGGSELISEDDNLNSMAVPEPSVLALVPVGSLALLAFKRRLQRV